MFHPKITNLKNSLPMFKPEHITKFLEINGKNLKEFYIDNDVLNSSIAKFCPNLKKIYALFSNDRGMFLNERKY